MELVRISSGGQHSQREPLCPMDIAKQSNPIDEDYSASVQDETHNTVVSIDNLSDHESIGMILDEDDGKYGRQDQCTCEQTINLIVQHYELNQEWKTHMVNTPCESCGRSLIHVAVELSYIGHLETLLLCPYVYIDTPFERLSSLQRLCIQLDNDNFAHHFQVIEILLRNRANVNARIATCGQPPILVIARNTELDLDKRYTIIAEILQTATVDLDWHGDGVVRKCVDDMFPGLIQPRKVDASFELEPITSLQLLCILLDNDNFESHFKLIKLLIRSNQSDGSTCGLIPSILTVVQNDRLHLTKRRVFVEEMLLISNIFCAGPVRKCAEQLFPDLRLPPLLVATDPDWDVKQLFICIASDCDDRFKLGFSMYMAYYGLSSPVDNSLVRCMLIEAIDRGRTNMVKLLLRHVVVRDVNECVWTACRRGHFEVFETVMQLPGIRFPNINKELCCQTQWGDDERFYKCFDVFLNDNRVKTDSALTGNVKLVCWKPRIVTSVLNAGAFIGGHDSGRQFSIESIDVGLIEDRLNRCVEVYGEPGRTECYLSFDYSNLRPPQDTENEYNESLQFLLDSTNCRHMLKHPLITSFMHLKWLRIRNVFYLNFFLVVLFSVVTILYLHLYFVTNTYSNLAWTVYLISCVGTICLMSREILQCYLISAKQYFRVPVNYLEIALIAVNVAFLNGSNWLADEIKRCVIVVATLLIFAEIFRLLSALPVMWINIHLIMLAKVFRTVLTHMLVCGSMLFAFALCFYTMAQPKQFASNVEEDTGLYNFGGILTSMVKVLIMMTGEIEASEMQLTPSAFGMLLLVMFVLLFTVSMFNLLTGLAVSEVHIIRSDAELTYYAQRAEILTHLERHRILHHPFVQRCKLILDKLGLRDMRVFASNENNCYVQMTEPYMIFDTNLKLKPGNVYSFHADKQLQTYKMDAVIVQRALRMVNRRDPHAALQH